MSEAVTQAAFSRLRGVARKTVTEWKAKGLLSMTPDGLVKVEESEWLLAERPANYRGGATKGSPPSQPRAAVKVMPDETLADAAARTVMSEGNAPYDHAEAVRIKENYLALLRQLEFDQKSGAVVPIDTVVAGFVEVCGRLRNKLSNIPTRIAPRAAVLRSAEEVRALIEDEITLVLQELTLDGEAHVTLDDLRDTIRDRFGIVH